MISKLTILALSSLIAHSAISQVVPNKEWTKYFSEKNQIANIPSAIDANANVYLAGLTTPSLTEDATTIKYAPSGTLLWVDNYNNGGYDNGKGRCFYNYVRC
jgi:hypothetical protein